jgi:hypothetical protein
LANRKLKGKDMPLFGLLVFATAIAVTKEDRTTMQSTSIVPSTVKVSQATMTPAPHSLELREVTTETSYTLAAGDYTAIDNIGRLCGFVTSDIHGALYCNANEYCNTSEQYLQCCSSTITSVSANTHVYTQTVTDRNSVTITSVVTDQPNTQTYTIATNCHPAASQACYNYNQTASCTGSCTNTALVCTDSYFPACAYIYSASYSTIDYSHSYTIKTYAAGISYLCDTASYSLTYGPAGYGPSTYTTVIETSTISEVFTPTPKPYSRTQASQPAATSKQEI